jgi:hypothetical protein
MDPRGKARLMSPNVAPSLVTEQERRHSTVAGSVSPEVLISRHVENARLQLAEGRERLKGARRRVVQLEDALLSWERLSAELRAGTSRGDCS